MKIIDFENHFFTQEYIAHVRGRKDPLREEVLKNGTRMWYTEDFFTPRSFELEDKLLDLGEGRLKIMDANGIDIAVLSLSGPNVHFFEPSEGATWARKVNDELSKVVKRYPDRFIGLACVAPQSPDEAADEVERAVTELGLQGVVIQSYARNKYLDDKKYWVIFEKAEKLDVPIYLHPEIPPEPNLKLYADYGFPLAGPILGYAADASLHTMRLIYSGLFDKYPRLKMVLGHLGEGLVFFLNRIDFCWLKPWVKERPNIEKRPSDYIKTNFTVTISGMSFHPALMCTYLALGADNIAFATDYPYETMEESVQFMKEALLCDTDKEKIYHLNAERLFKL